MKTTLDLPDELMREIKIRAAIQGRKLKDVVAESIRRGLFPESKSQDSGAITITTDPEFGFLVVKGPNDAPISKMSIEEILKLEQDALVADDSARAGITF